MNAATMTAFFTTTRTGISMNTGRMIMTSSVITSIGAMPIQKARRLMHLGEDVAHGFDDPHCAAKDSYAYNCPDAHNTGSSAQGLKPQKANNRIQ
jgi:hypothetical protein